MKGRRHPKKTDSGTTRPDFFLSPASVAVVGASSAPGKLSGAILASLKAAGFQGRIFGVNPKYPSIDGIPCYPSLTSIKGDVDVAIFATPASEIPETLKEGAKKIKGAIIVSGGFAESGEAGATLEKAVREISKETGVRVIGPNCMGIYDTISRLDTFFISNERIKRPVKGTLSIISQSGSFAVTAMDELATEGIGVARVISYGNKADINEADCLDMLADDGDTSAVAIYIEAVEDGRGFVEAAKRCASKKPVMAIKVGRTGAAVKAARSHTGALAGRYEVYRAAFKKAGIIELGGYEAFLNACKAYGALKTGAKGRRVVIITDGGGIGVSLVDECLASGLSVPALPDELKKGLGASFPSYFAIENPLDLTGSATDAMFAEALEKTLSSGYYDMAVVAALWGPPGLSDNLPKLLGRLADNIKRPVIICTPGGEYTRKKAGLFGMCGLPVFLSPEAAIKAAVALSGGR